MKMTRYVAPSILGGLLFTILMPNMALARYYSMPSFYPLLAQNTFIFYPKKHRFVAIKNGKVVKSGRASGGRGYCPDIKRSCRTPVGVYSIRSLGGPGCRSSRYPLGKGGAKMPYCMFFSKYYAVHGSSNVPNYNASHGCIRVRPDDAAWLRHHFMHIGTKVIVKSY